MSVNELKKKLAGIIPPMATLLDSDGQFDVSASAKLTDQMLRGGVHGLFLLGTCGEGPSTPDCIRHKLITTVCEQVAGRVPVLVGVSDPCFQRCIDLAKFAADAGAEAIVSTPPFYHNVNQVAIHAWFQQLADASPLPLVLYNMPGCTHNVIELDTVADLQQHPNVAAIKDSSGDLSYFKRLVEAVTVQSFPVLIGPEELLLQGLQLGGSGGVSGGANFLPALYVSVYDAFQRNDIETAEAAQAKIVQVVSNVYQPYAPQWHVAQGIKAALAMQLSSNPAVLPPLANLDDDVTANIQKWLLSRS